MNNDIKPKDSLETSWVDLMPRSVRPYLRLIRADRPIGTWLLLWPCWWSLALTIYGRDGGLEHFYYMGLFALGAFVMRGAGCAYNDIVDRDFDAQVERTKNRPIPAGQISVKQAWAFTGVLCVIGLVTLLQFNGFTRVLGLLSLPIVALYPFAKRITNWPQAVLGLAFNWGALMGWASLNQSLGPAPILLYCAGVFWTLGYDTVYAHQDKEDDALIGVKSTAQRFGEHTHLWISAFYVCTASLIILAAIVAQAGLFNIVLIIGACLHLGWQIAKLDISNPARCLKLFRSNHLFGLLIFTALAAPQVLDKIF